jgi:hypothetical protein
MWSAFNGLGIKAINYNWLPNLINASYGFLQGIFLSGIKLLFPKSALQ